MKRLPTREYYQSEHWRQLVEKYCNCHDAVCEICGTRRYQFSKRNPNKILKKTVFTLHHTHYHTVGREKREDLQVLCRTCHSECHKLLKRKVRTEYMKRMQELIREYFRYEDPASQ